MTFSSHESMQLSGNNQNWLQIIALVTIHRMFQSVSGYKFHCPIAAFF